LASPSGLCRKVSKVRTDTGPLSQRPITPQQPPAKQPPSFPLPASCRAEATRRRVSFPNFSFSASPSVVYWKVSKVKTDTGLMLAGEAPCGSSADPAQARSDSTS
jgi:hypothetical protein